MFPCLLLAQSGHSTTEFRCPLWGFGTHILILHAFSIFPTYYPHAYPLVEFARYSPSTRRRCSSRISSAMLVRDNQTSSANGAFGRHDRHDSAGMRLLTAASG